MAGRIWKQFKARDLISRWDTVDVGRQATARAAADVLDRLAERMPFSIHPGDQHRQRLRVHARIRGRLRSPAISLFVVPPRSPKLDGTVERANRTHLGEFYRVTDAEHP